MPGAWQPRRPTRHSEELTERLRSRYLVDVDLDAVPFVVDSEGRAEIFLEDVAGIPQDTFLSTIRDELFQVEDSGILSFEYDGTAYRAYVSVYEPWEWYSGYLIPESARLEGPTRFASYVGAGGRQKQPNPGCVSRD